MTVKSCLAALAFVLPALATADEATRLQRVEIGLRPPVVVAGDPAWTLRDRMAHYRVPGLQVAVIDGFKVAWEKGYGTADAASGRAVTADTLFQAASISKSHTAAAALKLVEQGRLALDAPINDSLRTWKVPANEFTRKQAVTLAQLLSHTAGTSASGFPGYVPGDPLPTLTQILDGAPPANTVPIRIDKTPGESFRYSGGGTTIVQLAIQDVSGQAFAAHMKAALLDPLGLTHATFAQPLPADRLPNAAVGHGAAGRPIVGERHVYPELAAAGLWTTAGDLARFGIAMQESLAGRPGAYLKPETAKRLVTVVAPPAPAALGFFVDAFGWKGFFAHAGGNEGFTCLLLLHREKGYGAAVMTNSENGPDLVREILRSIALEYGWEGADLDLHTAATVPAERLASFAGRYVLGSDSAMTIAAQGSRLVMREALREDVVLVPIAAETFVRADQRTRYRFEGGRLIEGEGEDQRSAAPATGEDRVPSEQLAAGQTEVARQAFQQLSQARGDDPELAQRRLQERGLDLFWRGDATRALALLEMNAALHPGSAQARAALAEVHAARGDGAAAARAYREALALAPTDPETVNHLDWARYVWARRAQALESPGAKPNHQHYEKTAETEKPSATGELAPRLQDLGTHVFPVTTRSAQAQRFVNQGLRLTYGFNHAEAGRSFREAARLDPGCAMAFWGQALVLGPNINVPMAPDDEPKAYALAQKAAALRARGTPRERAYIDALAKRYSGQAEGRSAGDRAYADAMRAVMKRFPSDLDAATLFAEAVMDLRPWGYWMPDGSPYAETPEAVAVLESVLKRNPSHPGANHFYIHLLEPTAQAGRAEAAADRLLKLMPGAGHIVHMPSHIYMRVGRYADASSSNEQAVRADEDYIAQCRAQGIYPMGYYPHNIHFLWSASSMEGRSQAAIEAARKVAARVSDEAMDGLPLLAGFKLVPYYALTRFGRWDEMLAEPAPPDRFLYLKGTWHYARGLAHLGKGHLDEAEKELAEVRRIAADPALDFTLFSPNTARAIFAIAPEVLAGELAAKRKDYDRAIAHLERGVRLEDGLVYTEPAEWHYPVRHALAAVLLEAGRPKEAETVYWDDLKRNPENGWSLFGLTQALRAQQRDADAALIEARRAKAWVRADVTLSSSRF